MLYLERTPALPLRRCVRMLWYARAPQVPHRRERVLPNGCVQIVINLARDFLHDCTETGEPDRRTAPALIVGARANYEIVNCSDMADLAGIVFEPGGFSAFARDRVDAFSNGSTALDDVWGGASNQLRDRLREVPAPLARLRILEDFLLTRAACAERNRLVEFAVGQFGFNPAVSRVAEVAAETGWSVRHFSQIFREQVGLTPKVWCRIQRFQMAVRQLHAGEDLRWAELALACGYYDQAHFANEFRAFSGIDATSYSARRTLWANHVPVD